jgi:hypothetical protein
MDITAQNTLPDVNAEVSVGLSNAIDHATVVGLMKQYVKYLFKHNVVSDKEAAKQKVGVVLSPALDRGVITQAVLACVCNWIDNECCATEANHEARRNAKFICKALCEDLPGMAADDMPEIIKRAAQLKTELKQLCVQIEGAYGANIKSSVSKFLNEFGNLMEPEFVQKCSM